MFGIVPAALMGVDLGRFLERAEAMVEACRGEEGNPGLELGLRLGEGWRDGRDKICIDESTTGFGLWAEQLLAESTGKEGKGLIPAPGESPDGPDRQRGELLLDDPYDLGAEFYRWELATAVAGHVLEIHPFDQPNVQAAKDKTNEVLAAGEPDVGPRGSLDELLAQAEEGDYVCVQAFIDPAREDELAPLIERAHATGCVVTSGLGPRYLHSTGQLHKGGPNTGLFVQVLDEPLADGTADELPIPGPDFGFARLIRSQAAGDLAALAGAGAAGNPTTTGGTVAMQLGMVGLGRMGSGMTKRLEGDGHEVKTFDPKVESTAKTLRALAKQLDAPRHVWLMVPSGEITEDTFRSCSGSSSPATRSSTAATRTSATRSAATRRRARRRSRSSMRASRAGSGGSRSASA